MIRSPVVHPDRDPVERALGVAIARWAGGIFLALHGWLHWGIASAAQRPGAFRVPTLWGADHTSPVLETVGLGDASQLVGGLLWMAAAIGFVVAGASLARFFVPERWSRNLVLGSSACSLLLFWLFWTDPLLVGAAISAVLLAVAVVGPLLVRGIRSIRRGGPQLHHA